MQVPKENLNVEVLCYKKDEALYAKVPPTAKSVRVVTKDALKKHSILDVKHYKKQQHTCWPEVKKAMANTQVVAQEFRKPLMF